MTDKSNKVALVLEPNFGQRLEVLAIHSHVWTIDSPANSIIAEKYWQDNPKHKLETGITTFQVNDIETQERACLRILDAIDLHHGEYSSNPPYSAWRSSASQYPNISILRLRAWALKHLRTPLKGFEQHGKKMYYGPVAVSNKRMQWSAASGFRIKPSVSCATPTDAGC